MSPATLVCADTFALCCPLVACAACAWTVLVVGCRWAKKSATQRTRSAMVSAQQTRATPARARTIARVCLSARACAPEKACSRRSSWLFTATTEATASSAGTVMFADWCCNLPQGKGTGLLRMPERASATKACPSLVCQLYHIVLLMYHVRLTTVCQQSFNSHTHITITAFSL